MLSGQDRSAPVTDGRGTSGDARTRPATINNLKPKSSLVVLSKPGDGIRNQMYISTVGQHTLMMKQSAVIVYSFVKR